MQTQAILYFSSLCPDTPAFVDALEAGGPSYQALDIHQSMANLKAFLRLRDREDHFNSIKQSGMVGVPCLVTTDGKIITDLQVLEDYLRGDL